MKSLALLLALLCASLATQGQHIRFDRLLVLKQDEGVFAYARISPDGTLLAYASQMSVPDVQKPVAQTVTVVDLRSKRVLFEEPGIDSWWSNDGVRMIFRDQRPSGGGVSIRHQLTGTISRDVAPIELGDYFSWATRDGRDLVVTILGRYYYLDGDRAVLPAERVPACDGIGVGERPLVSRDGKRITAFVRGTIVVRDLTDCDNIIDTGIRGAKADFSWDGRYIAFHVQKLDAPTEYEIDVVDLRDRTVRNVTAGLSGSSFYPSWTRDGRLCFRHDGDDFKGFMMATNVLSVPSRPLPQPRNIPAKPTWREVFPETDWPSHHVNIVMVWSTWSAHVPGALADIQCFSAWASAHGVDVGVLTATEPASKEEDVRRMLAESFVTLKRIPLSPANLSVTEASNQIPTTLLFRDGRLVDRRMGAQTCSQLAEWVRTYAEGK